MFFGEKCLLEHLREKIRHIYLHEYIMKCSKIFFPRKMSCKTVFLFIYVLIHKCPIYLYYLNSAFKSETQADKARIHTKH